MPEEVKPVLPGRFTVDHIAGIMVGDLPIAKTNLQELEITKAINDHARIKIVAMIDDGEKPQWQRVTGLDITIKITTIDGKNLFFGIATHYAVGELVDKKGSRSVVTVEGASMTHQLDIFLKKRSFMDKGLTYKEVFERVLADYGVAIHHHLIPKELKTGQFFLQYNETDWTFLRRLASRCQTWLIPDAASEKISFALGLFDTEFRGDITLYDPHFWVRRETVDATGPDGRRGSADNVCNIYYEVRSVDGYLLELGEKLQVGSRPLMVWQAKLCFEQGRFVTYYLMVDQGKNATTLWNDELVGLALAGTVMKAERDTIEIDLQIDKDYRANEKMDKGGQAEARKESCRFTYSTIYSAEENTGLYWMPELNDTVFLYFPTNNEQDAYVFGSVRRGAKIEDKNNKWQKALKIGDPNVRYFRTGGKEIMFSPEEIRITVEGKGSDNKDFKYYVTLHDERGIEIYSTKDVNVFAKRDINLNSEAGAIAIQAGGKINLACQESSIIMNGDTHIKGKTIRTN